MISDLYLLFFILISNTVRALLFGRWLWWMTASLAGWVGMKTAAWHPLTGTDWHRGSSSSDGEVKLSVENTCKQTKKQNFTKCMLTHLFSLFHLSRSNRKRNHMNAVQSRKHKDKVRLSNREGNTLGLKSSLSLVPAIIHFLSGDTRRVLTLKESHTMTLDFWVKLVSVSVQTDPWPVPT